MTTLEKFWRGDVCLWKAYWLFGIAGLIFLPIIAVILTAVIGNLVLTDFPYPLFKIWVSSLSLVYIAYAIFIVVVIFRCTKSYQGSLKWAFCAKVSILALTATICGLAVWANHVPASYVTDPDFVLLDEIPSKDKAHVLLIYNYDTGALGYSRVFWAVVPAEHRALNLNNYRLPDGYKGVGWTSSSELIVQQWEPYYYIENYRNIKNGDTYLGVKVKLIAAKE